MTKVSKLKQGTATFVPGIALTGCAANCGQNINETTIVRFDASGQLTKAYKTNTRASSSGNPFLDAANSLQ